MKPKDKISLYGFLIWIIISIIGFVIFIFIFKNISAPFFFSSFLIFLFIVIKGIKFKEIEAGTEGYKLYKKNDNSLGYWFTIIISLIFTLFFLIGFILSFTRFRII